jgi:hypothetical protein
MFIIRFLFVLYFRFIVLRILCFGLFCVLLLLLYVALPFLLLYKSADRCHWVKNKLRYMNIISHHIQGVS